VGALDNLSFGPGGPKLGQPLRRRPQDEEGGNIFGNFLGDVADIGKGLGQLVGAGLSDIYRLGAESFTGGSYTGGEDRPQGQFSLDDIFIGLTGWDPGDPERSRQTRSGVALDLEQRYGPLLRGDFGEFASQVGEHPGFFALDLLGAGSAVGKGAQAVGRSAIASRAGAGGRLGEIASGAQTILGEAGRRARPALTGATLDDLAQAGAQLGPIESLASRILPRTESVLLPSGGGVSRVETLLPSYNPVRRAMTRPITRAMTEPLGVQEARLGRLEALKEAGETLSFADQAWLDTVGKTVKEARAAGATRAYRPVVTSRLLRNSVNKLVGSHSAEWLSRRQADLKAIQDITRPVVQEGLEEVAHGAAQRLDVADEIGAVLRGVDAPDVGTFRPATTAVPKTPRVDPGFGESYGSARYITPEGQTVFMYRKGQRVRFFDADGNQVGPEHHNVAPATAWAAAADWTDPDSPAWLDQAVKREVRAGGTAPQPGQVGFNADDVAPIATATRTRPLGSVAFEALEQAEEGSLEARVRDLARPSYDHLQDLRARAAEAPDPAVARQIDLSERFLDHQMEALRVDRRTKAGEAVSTLERWQEDMRLFVAREQNALIEAGIMSPAELMERAYLPLRHRFGAKFDQATGQFVGGPAVEALDDAVKATGRTAPIYFPHVDSRRLKFSDYLMSRGRIGARKATADPHLKRNTAELLDKDLYVKDPVEAYSRRAARAIRAEETARFVQKVAGAYGRKLEEGAQLAPGEVVWAPDGLLRFFRTQVKLEDEIADLMSAGLSQDEALAGALKEVVGHNLDEVRRTMVGVTRKGLDLYAVPQVVADQIEAFTKFRLGRNTRLFWDGPTNVWRSLVLLGSPRWIVNNFLGNIVFQKLQGGRLRGLVAQLDEDYRRMLKETPGAEQVEQGLYGQQSRYVERLGTHAREGVGQAMEALKGTKVVTGFRRVGEASGNFNALLEDAFRRESYVTALERQQIGRVRQVARTFWGSKRRLEDINRRGASQAMIREALEEHNRFFGDYKNLGPIERGIVRRFMFPFWGFYKHTLKLAASMPVEAPGRTIALRGLADVASQFQEDLGPMPPWLESAGFPLGPGDAGAEVFLGLGANPFSFATELAEDPTRALGQALHPLPTTGIEQATGRSMFTGREFSGEDVVSGAFGSDQQFLIDPETGEVIKPLDRPQPPGLLEHLLQQVPQYDLAKDILAGGATYDTASLLDILQGQGVIRDEATGEPRYPNETLERLLKMFGVSTFEQDIGRYQQELSEGERAAMREALRRQQSLGRQGTSEDAGSGSALGSLTF
jgi:hypothetical protein